MPRQVPVTVRAEVLAGHGAAVADLLTRMRAEGPHKGLRLGDLAGLHFARVFLLDATTLQSGRQVPLSLVYMADVDGSATRHLKELVSTAADGVDELFGHCLGYPQRRTDAHRLAWLREHGIRPAASYVHTVGRTVAQARAETRLYARLRELLDDGGVATDGSTPAAIRDRLRDAVLRTPGFSWARRPAPGPGLVHELRETAHLAVGVALVALAAPVLVPAAAGWALLVRLLEHSDTQEHGAPDVDHVDEVRRYEEHGAQNPFTAVGEVKAGGVRRVTMRVALAGLDFACRHAYARDNLAGVDSIHFARWQPIDDGQRLIFASSYDGSLESYMDDFISRLSWGINLVFGNGVGFPRTRWLVLGGARDEISYKHYLRRHQVPTVVFYSAYADHTARNLDTYSQVRAGIASGDRPDADRWLARL